MRLLVTGGSGVLGRTFLPLAREAGHAVDAPAREELDLFDHAAVAAALEGHDGVLHLATRIPKLDRMDDMEAWRENDRLRTEASAILVDAALAAGTDVYVQPTVAFVYPPDGPTTEDTPIGAVEPTMRSGLHAEEQTARFAAAGRRGVVLRFGLLDGPGTGHDAPVPVYGSTLHVHDAGRALLSALTLPSGIYNVCRDGERVCTDRFAAAAGWRPGPRPSRPGPAPPGSPPGGRASSRRRLGGRAGDSSAHGSTSPRRIA
jgi:nucleoside-diphosphate-sugar epimerase